jgi:SAM-dependent methyltransferase
MCTSGCIKFGKQTLTEADIKGKRVIEIGSYDVNGSLRPFVQSLNPAEYIGVDVEEGYGVDIVCDAGAVRDKFGDDSFDVVISTELMEHILDWRKVISDMKRICRPGGVILITTRSFGFAYHGWPYDFWRFEVPDMEQIFSDFSIENVERESPYPGVFIKARKPAAFLEKDLSSYELFSIVTGKRQRTLDQDVLAAFVREHADQYRAEERSTMKSRLKKNIKNSYWKVKKAIY